MAGITLTTAILWSLCRSLLVGLLALIPLTALQSVLSAERSLPRRRLWLLTAMGPFFVPELLTGFQYRLTAASLAASGDLRVHLVLTELLYGSLLIFRAVAVGMLLQAILPPTRGVSPALHLWGMLRGTGDRWAWWLGWGRLQVTGRWRALLVSWCLMSLVSFQEFETAALMQIDRHPVTWTVWLFDAQAAMQPLTQSLRQCVLPVGLAIVLLLPLLLTPRDRTGRGSQEATQPTGQQPGLGAALWVSRVYVIVAALLLVILPLGRSLIPALAGLGWMLKDSRLVLQSVQQVLVSAGFAVTAAVIGLSLCELLRPRGGEMRTGWRECLLTVLLLPGLAGPLMLSLTLLNIFQWGIFRWLYDTWLPLLLGQVLFILPRAFALSVFLRGLSQREATYAGELLRSSGYREIRKTGDSLVWYLRDVRWLLGGLLLTQWCFWDVTVSSLLRPVTLEPVVTRLYNEMHFSRTEALLGLSFLAAVTPVVLWGLALLLSRVAGTKKGRSID